MKAEAGAGGGVYRLGMRVISKRIFVFVFVFSQLPPHTVTGAWYFMHLWLLPSSVVSLLLPYLSHSRVCVKLKAFIGLKIELCKHNRNIGFLLFFYMFYMRHRNHFWNPSVS